MKRIASYYVAVLGLLFIFSACQHQNPVQLNDDDIQAQDIVVENKSMSIEPLDASGSVTDGLILTSEKRFYGKIVVAGAEYDGPAEHHEASLAQAIFFSRTEPVIFNNDTIAYRAIGAGTVSVDNLSLRADPVRLNLPGIPIDTIGTGYSLLNVDGIGAHGFQYVGGHGYQWDVGGSSSLPSFHTDIDAPPNVHVFSPAAGESFSRTRNVQMKWRGGGQAVTILISDFREGSRPKPLLQLRVKKNKGRLLLPKRILQLLPENHSRFLFTFSSNTSFVMRLYSLYQENIAVTAVTTHSLVYYLN
ncbi:MAG TPA: hypothetical protein VJ508_19230 [Saprospiraceae bacterium]|nr:hypothetical protein [Saprospiraceae bacterium]